ncbi:YbdD/YjiX family protein [Roseisolibacter sp. H3M3-2]|uniref:YbdD/YjiX family protein n=1 Tax=Roseisolibacter sp. H3M3-2 TaxID=3031323 RepID=UPI0023DC08ED|nr:YbdD/YjiX family protein [Roseisolibacter sp. H3M3-2]MDF1501443.1 YbdD/YjiX family protein [Roseisolibacter sp. H3M3-2]
MQAIADRLDAVRRVLYAVLGVPDYDRYVRQLRERHPECAVPTRREFEQERLKARYEKPGSRCC